ncbi:MAG TPA: hypothetical protein DCM10_14490 [Xanthomarina gelatinilytica]|nr:hypothetical protein [Xanthomarina gelatinilytica]|tara:strand:- start:290 stop:1189 length:900 start_codon:yes stop_codon:yes gene_type:complete
MNKTKYTFNRAMALELVELVNQIENNGLEPVLKALEDIEKQSGVKRGTWGFYANKFKSLLLDDEYKTIPFSIFASGGNSKLPFVSFSTIPGATCPGAGECLDFCYSFKAWRYPAAFFRQLQNFYLMNSKNGRDIIASEFKSLKLKKGKSFLNLRLYVDGDFKDINHLTYWMNLLFLRPEIKAYGYSKSWKEFLIYDSLKLTFPENYKLNLSSGSIHNNEVKNRMNSLSCTRGEFVAVEIDKQFDAPLGARTREYKNAVKTSLGDRRAFICPGLCGSCTPNGHACGSDRFKGVTIAIATH